MNAFTKTSASQKTASPAILSDVAAKVDRSALKETYTDFVQKSVPEGKIVFLDEMSVVQTRLSKAINQARNR
jgi:gluconate kinase